MKETRSWILVLGILLIVGWAAFGVVGAVREMTGSVSNTTEDALKPITDVTGGLATQVAQFLNPTPTVLPDPVTIIRDVRTIARLETIQYSIEKVVTADKGQGSLEFLFGDQLIFVAHGVVIAGVDLGDLAEDDFWLDGGVLYMRLPPPEIFIATLDNDKSYVYDRDTGLFTKGDIHLETAARQVAEDEIENAAFEDGILEQAQVNAETYLLRFLSALGYSDVIFVTE
ncbi:MAG: DUF4230 domain-containing protein [Anaerolineae bacterium]|nr:DUF4230 domain-containing protein [Anaerolineae bacterium]MBL6965356.1 DUF4230 domain-containing protein [Anaerolineales bacterium]